MEEVFAGASTGLLAGSFALMVSFGRTCAKG
jgi:hypothetical protein